MSPKSLGRHKAWVGGKVVFGETELFAVGAEPGVSQALDRGKPRVSPASRCPWKVLIPMGRKRLCSALFHCSSVFPQRGGARRDRRTVSGSLIKGKRYFHVFKMVAVEWLSAVGIPVGWSLFGKTSERSRGGEWGTRFVMKVLLKKCALPELIVVRWTEMSGHVSVGLFLWAVVSFFVEWHWSNLKCEHL